MISRFLLFLSVVFLGIGQIWGQTTVTSNFGATSGSIDSNISFTTEKNSAQSPPAWNTNSNELRLYFHSSGDGGSVTLHPAEGIIITDVSLTTASTSYTPTVKYNIDGGGDQTAALSGTTYTISDIEATESLRIRNANTTNTQLRLTGITVTYEFATTDPIFNTSSSEITNLGYMEGNASVSQSFSLSGMNLEPTSGNITVTAPANFQVSTDDVNFSNSLTIPYTAGSLSATDLYVKLNNGLSVGNYNGDITISGGSANATLNVEGIVTEFSEDCGFENFDNANLTSSYADGSFVGNNGITWTYVHSRDENGDENNSGIIGNAIMLRRASDNSAISSSTISNGIGNFSVKLYKGFTGSGNRQVELFVNGISQGTSAPFNDFDEHIFEVNNINIEGDFTIEIKNITSNQIIIDDITWTCYSSTPQAPVITSPLTHSSEYGAAATYTITADYLPTSFNATGLPAGLSINTSTGEISGTVTADVGNYNINISATNDEGTDTETLVWTVTPKALTATLSVENKVYDGTTTATISSSPTPTLSGIVGSDDVSLSGTPTATFDNKNTGTNKTVTISGYSLSGTKAGNYTLTTPTATANITAKSLTVSGATAQDKDYDGSNTATITGSTLEGVINPDNVTVSGGGTFASPNAGTGISVTANLTLGGADAGNYTLIQPSGLVANINKVAPEISPTIITLNVGGTYSLPGGISSDSDGNMTFSMVDNAHATLSGNIINGISIGANTLTISIAQGTNHTATTASITVNVTDFIFLDGDVRPLYDGADFSHNNAWEIYNSATNTWTTRDASLQNAKPTGRILIDKQDIGAGGNNSNTYLNDIIILSGGELFIRDVAPNYDYTTWSYFLSLNKNLTVQANGKLIVEGDIRLGTNILTIEKDGELILDNPYMRNDNGIWAGTENFMDGSIVTIKDWEWDASSSVSSLIQIGAPGISNNPNGYKFGNLIIDAELYEHWTLIGSTNYPNLPLCYGNLEIYNTSEDWFIAATSNNSSSFVVNGNLIIYDGWFNFGTTYTGGNDFINHYTINGSLINISDDNFKLHHVEAESSTPSGSVTIKGNIEIGEDVIISNDGNKKILLETGNDEDPKFIDIASNVVRTDIDINSGYRILKKDLVLGTNSKVTVNNNSTLNFGFDTSGTNPLAIRRFNNNATQTGQSFELKNGGILKITSPDGITSGGTYTGNVQVGSSNSNRIFGGGATYHYIGKTNQSTGNGLPDGITGKLIIELETDDSNENLEFTSTGTNTFGTIDGVNGILEIRKGKVIDQPNSGFRNYNGTTNENEDGESDPQKGDIIMTGGRYVVSGGGTKPSLSGSYTLTDGTVEFAGTANTKIRVKPLYHNMDVSGSNVTAGGKNLIVNNLTKVIGTGKLTIPETDDSATPYVLTARKGIQVASGATALFENNANLMQDPGAVNSGKVSMLRKANVPSNQYNYWSSPVSGQNLYEIYNVPNNRVMIYNTDDDYFTIKPNPHQSEFGIGYSIKGPVTNEPQTPSGGIEVVANFIGTPRNESLTISENRIPLSDVGNHYNLIGNPFPSNLDLIALYNDNNSKFFDDDIEDTPTAYFWDNVSNTQMTQQGSNYNQSNYALLNLSSGIGTAAPCNSATCSGDGSGKKPNGIVKPGQGFIIRAAEDADHLTLKNDMRTTLIKRTSDDDEAVYFKTGNLSAEHNGERPRNDKFWVELVTADDLHIQAAVGYFTQAENSFERFDSKVMNEDASDNIYTLSEDDVKLSIQGRKGNFSNEDIIPLGVRFFKYGIHKIQLEETKGIFKEHQDIYVKDKYLNITHNLSANGPYLIDAQAGEFNDRFEIVFKPSLSSTVNPASPLNSLKIEKRDHQIEISSSVEKITEVEIFNLSGWSVYKAEQVNENILKIPASQFGKEIIIVNVQTESGKTETKKIINK